MKRMGYHLPRARTVPSPAKTKMKVERSSDKVARMESGWVASSALPNAYLRAGIAIDYCLLRSLLFLFGPTVFTIN